MHTLIPNADVISRHLTVVADVCSATEVVMFEKTTFLVIATSEAPEGASAPAIPASDGIGGLTSDGDTGATGNATESAPTAVPVPAAGAQSSTSIRERVFSSGTVAGIAVGTAAGLLLVVFLVLAVRRRTIMRAKETARTRAVAITMALGKAMRGEEEQKDMKEVTNMEKV